MALQIQHYHQSDPNSEARERQYQTANQSAVIPNIPPNTDFVSFQGTESPISGSFTLASGL